MTLVVDDSIPRHSGAQFPQQIERISAVVVVKPGHRLKQLSQLFENVAM